MFKFWTHSKKYLGFRQSLLLAGVLLTGLAEGQGQSSPRATPINRAPSSYMPDDDVIVKPHDNQLSFYQQYIAEDESQEVVQSRNQLKVWNDNTQFAEQYGADTTLAGSNFVPSSDDKWEYFKDKYMRYLRRKGEQPLKDMPKTWYQEYRASNEVDTIDEMEARFKKTNRKSNSGSVLPSALQEREVSVFKNNKLIFQPRLDQGLVIVGIKGPLAYARAWVGVNGKTEVNVQKNIDPIGFRAMYNYETDTGKYFTSVDQRLMENIYARATSSRTPNAEIKQDETLMLLYAKQF
jgi:hypothetical protein